MNINKIKTLIFSSSLFLPGLALAQSSQPSNFQELVAIFLNLIGLLIPVLMSLAVLVFLWGLFEYMRTSGAEREEGRRFIVWGVISLFVMVSIWGLVGIMKDTFIESPASPYTIFY